MKKEITLSKSTLINNLSGSDKQIAWAADIIDSRLDEINLYSLLYDVNNNGGSREMLDRIMFRISGMKSSEWISCNKLTPFKIIETVMSKLIVEDEEAEALYMDDDFTEFRKTSDTDTVMITEENQEAVSEIIREMELNLDFCGHDDKVKNPNAELPCGDYQFSALRTQMHWELMKEVEEEAAEEESTEKEGENNMKKSFEEVYQEVVDMMDSMIHGEAAVLQFRNHPGDFIDSVTLREAWELSPTGDVDIQGFAEYMLYGDDDPYEEPEDETPSLGDGICELDDVIIDDSIDGLD